MRRLLVLSSLFVLGSLACGKEDAAASDTKSTAKVVRGVDTKRIPVPNHGPKVMAGEVDKALKVSSKGKFSAQFHDKPHEFVHFSPGENAAIYAEETDVARIMITAAKGGGGFPRVEVRLRNVRLDELEFPVTFPLEGKAKKKVPKVGGKEPELEIRYLEDEARFWILDDEDTKAGKNTVTLSSFEEKTLTGSMQARLIPHVEGMGEIIEIKKADFEIEMRLRGVKPGKPEATEGELAGG